MQVLNRVNLEQFEEEGYTVVEGALDVALDIQPVIDEYTVLLDRSAARWKAEGKLSSTYSELPLVERLVRIIQEGVNYGRELDIALPQGKVAADTPLHLGPAVFNMLRSPRLMDVAEQIIGPEIYCHPVHHIRMKPPERLVPPEMHDGGMTTATSWHQDQGVVLEEADQSKILT